MTPREINSSRFQSIYLKNLFDKELFGKELFDKELFDKLIHLLSLKPLTLSQLEGQTGVDKGQLINALRLLEKSKKVTSDWEVTKSKTLAKKMKATKIFKIR